ncbi:aminotransferase class I/II-fold pyridoxal phosphate-dependent enzyme [Burkholderia glumae]|uniref:aminotransferase class I/II-fold pyridoxal phosphate-dependent enzyme n=1 Tax=Burkholderia glumae TaxID=337 RepID=UPI0005BCACDD|nr:aminotransferase class I/II-fold pyridoxal phosphate-dependent enzyme [Burkholderia glumae]
MAIARNQFVNFKKMADYGEPSWNAARKAGLIDLSVKHTKENRLTHGDHEFINMCSCSYLGLDIDERILEGAKAAIDAARTLHLTTARVRIFLDLLENLEEELSAHYSCGAMSYNSCAAASSAFLPLLASGLLTGGEKPVLVVDKSSHFSINHVLAICGDETEVISCPHNDVSFVEEQCNKHGLVAFVGDGTYSMGGHAPIADLLDLQRKHRLFLYFDDSHGLSTTHSKGWGYVRSAMEAVNSMTAIVGSLAKGFGACGGVLMFGSKKFRDILIRYGNSWSQYLNSAGIGAALASLKIHQSSELSTLQSRLWENVAQFDHLAEPEDRGINSPIRLIRIATPDAASDIAERIYRKGFYTSPVFFPIVPRGTAGLRVMLRANMTSDQIAKFSEVLKEEITSC